MRKHFLILMLMALLPMVGFAASLDPAKFTAQNITYGTTAFPTVTATGYTEGVDYTYVNTEFYTDDQGGGAISLANLSTTAVGKYYVKINGAGVYVGQTVYVDFWIYGIAITASDINLATTSMVYNGSQLVNTPTVTVGGNTLTVDEITDVTADGGKVTFTGQYKRNANGDLGENVIFPYNTADDASWVQSDGTAQIPDFSAYVIYPEELAAAPRIYVEDIENGMTTIKQIGVDGTAKAYSVDGWYTLNGVKLPGVPTQKGVYINNGKKVVIK